VILSLLLLSAIPAPEGYDRTTDSSLTPDTGTLSQIVDLRECVAGSGVLPGSCFFAQWKRPWVTTGETIDGKWTDRELRDTVLSSIEALRIHFKAGPVLSFTENEKVITEAQYAYFAAFRNQCPECWNVRRLEPWELDIANEQAERAGISGDWRYSVRYEDLWADHPTLNQAMDMLKGQGFPRAAAFLSPADLDYVWGPDRMALFAGRISGYAVKPEPVPAFVIATLRHNKAFICRAQQIVQKSGLTWAEWMQTHGYVPGDRTPLDIQYNQGLRWGTRPYLIETFEPFGRVMPYDFDYGTGVDWDLYREEKRRHKEETTEANRLVDDYLGSCR